MLAVEAVAKALSVNINLLKYRIQTYPFLGALSLNILFCSI